MQSVLRLASWYCRHGHVSQTPALDLWKSHISHELRCLLPACICLPGTFGSGLEEGSCWLHWGHWPVTQVLFSRN